jgi:hypothetical protein
LVNEDQEMNSAAMVLCSTKVVDKSVENQSWRFFCTFTGKFSMKMFMEPALDNPRTDREKPAKIAELFQPPIAPPAVRKHKLKAEQYLTTKYNPTFFWLPSPPIVGKFS